MTDRIERRAVLSEAYTVYLAAHDVDVTLPPGTEFMLVVKHRGQYIGLHDHAQFGEVMIDTTDARETA